MSNGEEETRTTTGDLRSERRFAKAKLAIAYKDSRPDHPAFEEGRPHSANIVFHHLEHAGDDRECIAPELGEAAALRLYAS